MKLKIELVPQTSWYSNLRKELKSKEWENCKKYIYKKENYKCEICGGKGNKHKVECHEEWEYNEKTNIQSLKSLTSLCPSCHQVKHIGYAFSQGNNEKVIKHFMKINKITLEEALLEINKSFKIWKIRSNQKWTLDISKIKDMEIELSKETKDKFNL